MVVEFIVGTINILLDACHLLFDCAALAIALHMCHTYQGYQQMVSLTMIVKDLSYSF